MDEFKTIAFSGGTQEFFTLTEDRTEAQAARAIVIHGPLKGMIFELTDPVVSVGRRSKNDICIPGEDISGRHCTISRDEQGRYYLKDEGSTNGTRINGRRLPRDTRAPLTHGDKITLCKTEMFFVDPRESVRAGEAPEIQIDFEQANREAEKAYAEFASLRGVPRRGDSPPA